MVFAVGAAEAGWELGVVVFGANKPPKFDADVVVVCWAGVADDPKEKPLVVAAVDVAGCVAGVVAVG